MPRIPVIDLFAGPGGLGEGFSAFAPPCPARRQGEYYGALERAAPHRGGFEIRLSIEKDPVAHRTLELRAFFRQFPEGAPCDYYAYLRGDITRDELFAAHPEAAAHARREAWQTELGTGEGKEPHQNVVARIREVMPEAEQADCAWALIGGPPCQAYSLAGRSRMKDVETFADDPRHTLYLEYLRIIADHRPPVFVMENVQGILSSRFEGQSIFERIVRDLRYPLRSLAPEALDGNAPDVNGLHYRLYALNGVAEEAEAEQEDAGAALAAPRCLPNLFDLPCDACEEAAREVDEADTPDASDFLVRSERYGIPQARPRVFILGVRSDLPRVPRRLRPAPGDSPTLWQAIGDLPRLRSRISRGGDSTQAWRDYIGSLCDQAWFGGAAISDKVRGRLCEGTARMARTPPEQLPLTGSNWMAQAANPCFEREWFHDPQLRGTANHEARGHMNTDLWRYFFAATFASIEGRAPVLRDFPPPLHPAHKNVTDAVKGNGLFSDRFRVQVRDRPSTTVVSHISKDGHYYIHPDPMQCRSLTVREAARLQTFRDNYFFEGPRTEQYHQVGNAVPPLLARQIARLN